MSLLSEVQTLIDDTGVFWSDAHVYNAINEAQLSLFADTRWAVTTSTLALNTDDDLVVVPPDILIPQFITYLDTDTNTTRQYFPTSMARLEQWSRSWRGEKKALPRWFVVWDAEHFRVWPRPDQAYDFTLTGIGWPTEVSSTSTSIDGSHTYQLAVVFRAAAILIEMTRPDLADAFNTEAMEHLQQFKLTLRNQSSHNIRRLRPGTGFTVAQGGSIRVGRRLS